MLTSNLSQPNVLIKEGMRAHTHHLTDAHMYHTHTYPNEKAYLLCAGTSTHACTRDGAQS